MTNSNANSLWYFKEPVYSTIVYSCSGHVFSVDTDVLCIHCIVYRSVSLLKVAKPVETPDSSNKGTCTVLFVCIQLMIT